MDNKTLALVQNYSKSFVELIVEKGQIEAVYPEIETILSVIKETDLSAFLGRTGISQEVKAGLVRHFQAVDSHYLRNFIEVILQNGRENLLEAILTDSLKRFDKASGRYDVTVTSAVPLTDSQRAKMVELVENKFQLSARHLLEEVDPSIIGGFVLKANNQIIDTSIQNQLQQLKTKLK